jgi:hypothetical protein
MKSNCWNEGGCIFNSNNSPRYKKCWQDDYSVIQCKADNSTLNEDLQFLKELQAELKTQDHDSQAAPRFWAVGDFEMVDCSEDCQEETMLLSYGSCESIELEKALEEIKEKIEDPEEFSDKARADFAELDLEDTEEVLDWIHKYQDDSAYLVPVKEVHVIKPNTMFLTKAEAKEHIRLNQHHYSQKAHTYAMTAWRAPKVARLLRILEHFDWDSINLAKQ